MKRITAALLFGAAVLAPAARLYADSGHATQSTQGAQSTGDDAALLEFLGGIGSADDAWLDYLARTDPTKIASRPKHAPSDGSKPSDPPHAATDPSNGSTKK